MGELSSGRWLSWTISIDAMLVLSGATLTSFVGVTGLVRRMTLDRCLPQFLLKTTRRGTPHRIIIGFFLLTVSVLLIARGQLRSLAVVYTLSFLSVMLLFAIGNILLKVKRARLPRPSRAAWMTVLVAIAAVVAALIGNARLNKPDLMVFLDYLVPTVFIVTIMQMRLQLLQALVFVIDSVRQRLRHESRQAIENEKLLSAVRWVRLGHRIAAIDRHVHDLMEEIASQQLVFFSRGDNLPNLNRVMLYIKENEHTNRVKVVTVVQDENEVPPKLREHIRLLDEAYPDMQISLVVLEGEFTPELIQELSRTWSIPDNLMFIGSPGHEFQYSLADLGGVRLII
jgi:hypothetical protein